MHNKLPYILPQTRWFVNKSDAIVPYLLTKKRILFILLSVERTVQYEAL